jgi:Tfp pilus assembly protein PilX
MRDARSEEGFALVAAIVLLMVILGIGLGLLMFTDNQQKASRAAQASESAFNVAEAALNAQVGQISRSWPSSGGTGGKEGEALPESCTESTSTSTNGCPTTASLSAGYPNISPVPCTGISTKDAWGSALTNQWTTYVRDDKNKESSFFNSAEEKGQLPWDENEDGKLWVRSVAVVQCHVVSVVTLVSRQLVALSFPKNAVSGNWFKVTNNGNKLIVNTQGDPAEQAGPVGMRCEGVTICEEWDEGKQQVSPNTTKAPAVPSPIMSDEQLAAMKSQAITLGTFRTPTVKGCPTTMEQLAGLPAYIENCGNLKITSNGTGNSATSPGFLVLYNGTLELAGTSTFYGAIYAHNAQESGGPVVSLGGTTTVVGAIDVDGKGGIEFGASGINFIYNSKAINEVKSYAGATPTRNTFRVLPSGQ